MLFASASCILPFTSIVLVEAISNMLVFKLYSTYIATSLPTQFATLRVCDTISFWIRMRIGKKLDPVSYPDQFRPTWSLPPRIPRIDFILEHVLDKGGGINLRFSLHYEYNVVSSRFKHTSRPYVFLPTIFLYSATNRTPDLSGEKSSKNVTSNKCN